MLDDVSVVLIAQPATVSSLADWVQLLREDPDLAHATAMVAHPPELAALVATAVPPHWPRVALTAPDDDAATVAQILGEVRTGRFALLALAPPSQDAVRRIASAIATGAHQKHAAGPRRGDPVLLGHHATPVELVTAYIDHVLAGRSPPPDDDVEYLGHLALRSARLTVEWLDPRDGGLDIAVRLNLAGHRFAERPPWQLRVALSQGATPVVRSASAPLRERVDATGTARWEWLVTHLPLAGVRDGNFTVEVEVVGAGESSSPSRVVRPGTGALTAARSVRTTALTPQGGTRPVRYLLHTPAHGREARLRVGHGTGWAADVRWTAQLVAADLRYIIRGEGGRRMRLLRLVRLLTAPLFAGRQVWLIGERPDEAQDNGLHLFRYLRTHHPQRHVYYVLARSSPQYDRARRLHHVVPHSSARHQLLMLHADVLANAHSMHHLLPRSWQRQAFLRRLAWRVGAMQVFLQHGVHLSPEAVDRGRSGYDVILTSTSRESAALRAVSGYDRQIAEVGLPRFDDLVPTPASRTILVMPTWRRYLPSKIFGADPPGADPFEGSAYERFMTSLLTSRRLHRQLETHDYRLVFLPHPNVAAQFAGAGTAGERITVAAAGGGGVQELVRRCDVFVTDYSSVHFDAAYLGTPVVYAQFDREEYHARHAAPSWFDVDRDGFGPVATTVDGTVDELAALLARGCRRDPVFDQRVTQLFTYHDRDNSRRVVATIDARLRP